MVGPEIRETVNLALSAIILAALLSFIAFALSLTYQISGTYNDEVYTSESLQSYYQFSNLDGNNKLTGIDVVSVIRDYKDSEVMIQVRKLSGTETFTKVDNLLNKSNVTIDSLECKYYAPLNGGAGCDKGSIDFEYKSLLVYGTQDINTIDVNTYEKPSSFDTNVTAIILYQITN